MIAWREMPVDVGPRPIASLYRQLPLSDTLRIALAGPLPVVLVSKRAHLAVTRHLRSSEDELGGLLIGTAWQDSADTGVGPIRAVSVLDCVAAEVYASNAVSLRLDSDIWNRARSHTGDGQMVVGWYHSHPHIGAFFSAVDRRTQQGFFHHPWSIGWVLDPFASEGEAMGRMFVGAAADEILPTSIWTVH